LCLFLGLFGVFNAFFVGYSVYMITLEEAKAILKDDTMSDEEIYAVIKELQLLVELAFDNEIELKKS